jgi:hypothetical protein
MKLRMQINFSDEVYFDFYWEKEINDFPKIVQFRGFNWKFFSWNYGGWAEKIDRILHFSRIQSYDPDYLVDAQHIQDIVGHLLCDAIDHGCECGAHKTDNKNCHAYWCPKYKPFK